jgi:hypothetical protein
MTNIALFTVANNVNEDIVKRFLWSVKNSAPHLDCDVLLGSHSDEKQMFCKPTILNDILRKHYKKYSVMIQTDIDMLIPPGLIEKTYQFCCKDDKCFHCNFHYLESNEVPAHYKKINWKEIKQRKVISASGSWNGLASHMWKKSNGFAECIYNLGGPDSEFYLRTNKNTVEWFVTSAYPLCHVNHPRRSLPRQGKRNMKTARTYPTDYNWWNNRNEKICPTNIQIINVGDKHV